MSRYPSNQYSYQQSNALFPNRPRYTDQTHVRGPPVAMHFQDGRTTGSARFDTFAPSGMPPRIREGFNESFQPRPTNSTRQPWTSLHGQERNGARNDYYHRPPFAQASNSYVHSGVSNEGPSNSFNAPNLPMPPWAIASPQQSIRPPSIPMPPPNILPNTAPPFSDLSQQVRLRPDSQVIRHGINWNAAPSPMAAHTNYQRGKEISEQEDSDKLFVEQWLSKRNIHKTVNVKKRKVMKIHELHQELHSYLKIVDELQTCRGVLLQFLHTDEDNWQEIVKKTDSIKASLQELQSKLFSHEYVKESIHAVKKRRVKRENQHKRRRIKANLREDKQKRIILAHQRIDAWRHEIVSEINAKKMVDSLKSEAGQSLVEVRKKIVDCRKYLEKIDSAKELRGIRRQTALQRGIFIFGDQDEQFEKRVEGMRSLLMKRLNVYNSEEKTLVVMLEEEKEQLQREDDTKRKKLMEKEHLRLFGYDPLVESRRYWLQAEVNPISLVQIRRLWDVYLVPPTIMGADRVPDGWVTPEPFSNAAWNKHLKKKS